jgi:hypothetical protein
MVNLSAIISDDEEDIQIICKKIGGKWLTYLQSSQMMKMIFSPFPYNYSGSSSFSFNGS